MKEEDLFKQIQFRFFISEKKVLALKITEEWKNCKAYIYIIDEKLVNKVIDKGYPSYERHLFARFLLPPINEVFEIENEEKAEIDSWKLIATEFGLQYKKLIDEILEDNLSNDEPISNKWKKSIDALL
jgi:hypothetical protein